AVNSSSLSSSSSAPGIAAVDSLAASSVFAIRSQDQTCYQPRISHHRPRHQLKSLDQCFTLHAPLVRMAASDHRSRLDKSKHRAFLSTSTTVACSTLPASDLDVCM